MQDINTYIENLNKENDIPKDLFDSLKDVIDNYKKQMKANTEENVKEITKETDKEVAKEKPIKILDATNNSNYRIKKYYMKKESNSKENELKENELKESDLKENSLKETKEKQTKFYTIFSCKFAKKLLREGCTIADVDLNTKMSGVVFHFVNNDTLQNSLRKFNKEKDKSINKEVTISQETHIENNKESDKEDDKNNIPHEIVFSRTFDFVKS